MEVFLTSLTPQQRISWNSIKGQLVHGAMNTVTSHLGAILGKRNADDAKMELFLTSLTSQQRSLLNHIKDQLLNGSIGTAILAVLGKK
ncbi:unnamed protein product [Adineta steineri]|nr:unnamed protein product [Adineta steineri]